VKRGVSLSAIAFAAGRVVLVESFQVWGNGWIDETQDL
jgi:hypothetical protein